MDIKKIDQSQWQSILKAATKKKNGKHGYVAIRGEGQEADVQVFDNKKDMNKANYRKMSINEILALSSQKLTNESDLKSSEKALKSIKKIADAKSAKLNSMNHRVGRFFLSCFKYVCYGSLVGIPLGLRISRFQNEKIKPHQEELKNAYRFCKIEKGPQTEAFLRRIPQVFEDTKKVNNKIPGVIEGSVNDSIARPIGDAGMIDQFHKDHTRMGIGFELVDKQRGKNLKAQGLQKEDDPEFSALGKLEQVKDAVGDLAADQRWVNPLQAVVTQTTLNAALFGVITGTLVEGQEHAFEQDGRSYNFRMMKEDVSIRVEIIRNAAGEIDRMLVSSTMPSKIYQVGSLQNQDNKAANVAKSIVAVNTHIKFEMTLDEKGKVHVGNFGLNHGLQRL